MQESYAIMTRYSIPVSVEEIESVDTLRYTWIRLTALATEVQSHLMEIQPIFHRSLLSSVGVFQVDLKEYISNFDEVTNFFPVTNLFISPSNYILHNMFQPYTKMPK